VQHHQPAAAAALNGGQALTPAQHHPPATAHEHVNDLLAPSNKQRTTPESECCIVLLRSAVSCSCRPSVHACCIPFCRSAGGGRDAHAQWSLPCSTFPSPHVFRLVGSSHGSHSGACSKDPCWGTAGSSDGPVVLHTAEGRSGGGDEVGGCGWSHAGVRHRTCTYVWWLI
jgi:hypothetical protein